MVVERFKDGVPAEKITGLFAQLAALQQVIPGIEHFSGGPYASPERLNQGFTHGFLMTFRDAAARDAYLPHPEQERVKQAILPHVEDIIAFDFEE
jgi:hypothetical protein